MAWRRTGATPLLEPILTHFNDAYMRHPCEINQYNDLQDYQLQRNSDINENIWIRLDKFNI